MAEKTEQLGLTLYGPKDLVNVNGLSRNFAAVDEAIEQSGLSVYDCRYEGGVHHLTGRGRVLSFRAAADFQAGESFTVNGTEAEAQTIDGYPLAGQVFVAGAWILCVRDEGRLIFQFPAAASWGGDFSWKVFDEL